MAILFTSLNVLGKRIIVKTLSVPNKVNDLLVGIVIDYRIFQKKVIVSYENVFSPVNVAFKYQCRGRETVMLAAVTIFSVLSVTS